MGRSLALCSFALNVKSDSHELPRTVPLFYHSLLLLSRQPEVEQALYGLVEHTLQSTRCVARTLKTIKARAPWVTRVYDNLFSRPSGKLVKVT